MGGFFAKGILFFCSLQNQVADLKEICNALKKEKTEAEKKLAHIRGVCFFSLPTQSLKQLKINLYIGIKTESP